MSQPKVAIVHDWLVGGGAERVVAALHELYPEAPIYTSYCSDEWRTRLDNRVITGYLQTWPFSKLRRILPLLRLWWFRGLNLDKYDLVISSAGNGEAKHIRTKPGTLHINYCHSPVHFYWSKYEEYLKNPSIHPKWLGRIGLRLLAGPLRRSDYKAAQKVDYFIANSTYIQSAIKKYYGKDSIVIHPPVDVERFAGGGPTKRSSFLVVGRQVPDKHIDLAVQACSQLKLPLTVVGNGPEHKHLVSLAGPSVQFITDATDQVVTSHFKSAQAFIFASLDDFGITPVEAMAAGTPVIAYQNGGALDYVIPGKTGSFFPHQTVASLSTALSEFKAASFDQKVIRSQAQSFSKANFKKAFTEFIATL